MIRGIQMITEANRAAWNQIAPLRQGQAAEFFRAGGTALEPFERALAGDVTGERVVHLGCSCGDQVLSWAALGATAIGIDISDVAIDIARRKAADVGLQVDLRRADIFELPPDLTEIDLIYLSWGAICWVPHLAEFATIVAQRLRPGGSLLMSDHHPMWQVLAVRGDNHLAVAGDYFGRRTPISGQDEAKRPVGARGRAGGPAFVEFVWPVSDVVMSFVRAGLRLEEFFEAPEPGIYQGLGAPAGSVPAYYVIKATKPEK